jgi:hypothetical protein
LIASQKRRMTVCHHQGEDPEVMMFRCTACKRLKCGWCEGTDDRPGLCDGCWVAAEKAEGAVA